MSLVTDVANALSRANQTTLDVFYRRGPLTPRASQAKTGYLPRPALVKKSDILAYIDQIDPAIRSLGTDIQSTVTGIIVGGGVTSDAEKQILVDYGEFLSNWLAFAADMRAKWPTYDSFASQWPKIETAELQYRGFRDKWISMGHSASMSAPPEKKDISTPPPLLGGSGFSFGLGVGTGVVLLGAGVATYLVLRRS